VPEQHFDDSPRYRDLFLEDALEEFVLMELNLEQEYGLGTTFYNAVHDIVQGLREFPEMMPRVHKSGMWRAIVAGFPVHIFYRPENEFVVIYAIAHEKRKPFYWIRRLP
jgi:toxin ParE1/3/4